MDQRMRAPGFGGPALERGAFFPSSLHPHLPEAGRNSCQALVEDPSPGPRGSLQGVPRVSLEFHRVFESGEVLSELFLQVHSQVQHWVDLSDNKTSFPSPCSSWCQIRTVWGLRGGSEGAFSRKLGLFRGLAPQNWLNQEWCPL